ncbi:MAG: hypothetical protein AAFY63_10345 [Cyanobacteria bacterium J06643_13]
MRAFLISLISLVLIGGCHIIDPLNYDKETGAPEGAIEERHAWGNEHLGISYQQVITWLTQAEIVQENIGDVITVAPVGKPNFISSYFTDGLIGTFTLEVVGSEGKAIFSASGTAPCSMGGTCFNRGTLIVNGEDIAVHSSGISLKEFNQPENKIVSLSKEIQFYNRKYPESKNDPSKSNTSILNLWVERAEAYAKLKQYDRAIADIEVAISLFDQRNPSLSRSSARDLEDYMVLAALYNYFIQDYSQSAVAIARAIVAHDIYMAAINRNSESVNTNKQIDDLNLWLWIVRMKQGKPELADRELRQVLEEASKIDRTCELTTEISRFLLGDIGETELTQTIYDNPYKIAHGCYSVPSSKFHLNYYVGQKAIVNGDIDKGKEMLKLSLENISKYRTESKIAKHELNN